jgi:hypothetical protein
MMAVLLAIVIGASCALGRFRIPLVLAASAVLAAGAVVSGIVLRTHPWVIAAQGIGSIAVLQFVFVAVGLTRHYFQSRAAMPQIQLAIGQALQAELEVPRNLPPQLATLVAKLQPAAV